MAEITWKLMEKEDVDRVHEIELECFTIPWSRDSFLHETENAMARYVLLLEDGVIVGYAGMWLVLDEAHITNIAITKEKRGNGYGEKMLSTLVQLAADSGCTWMTLEVRRGNFVAQNLYRKMGFQLAGVRKRYYSDNGEDALVLAKEDMPEGHPENDPYLVQED